MLAGITFAHSFGVPRVGLRASSAMLTGAPSTPGRLGSADTKRFMFVKFCWIESVDFGMWAVRICEDAGHGILESSAILS